MRFIRSIRGSRPVVVRSWFSLTGRETETYRTANAHVPDKTYGKRITNVYETDTFYVSCPFCPVKSFEHVQNLPPDKTDATGYHRISPDEKRIYRIINGQEPHMNGHERTGRFFMR